MQLQLSNWLTKWLKVVSDPCKRHSKQQGSWLQAFEHEVHKLRDMLIEHHAEGQEYKQQARSIGAPPNSGTIIYRVLTDFEVRIVVVAAREFMKRGIRVGTYEDDGLKVEARGQEALSCAAQDWLMSVITEEADRVVFGGKAGG